MTFGEPIHKLTNATGIKYFHTYQMPRVSLSIDLPNATGKLIHSQLAYTYNKTYVLYTKSFTMTSRTYNLVVFRYSRGCPCIELCKMYHSAAAHILNTSCICLVCAMFVRVQTMFGRELAWLPCLQAPPIVCPHPRPHTIIFMFKCYDVYNLLLSTK